MLLRAISSLRAAGVLYTRLLCSQSPTALPSPALAGIRPQERPAYQTHEVPVYSLPLYSAPESDVESLSDHDVSRVLKAYGGLLRKYDTHAQRRERLMGLTRDRLGLTITGLVVSDKMDKSVVVAARRRAFAKKLNKEYAVTRRFKAHDEQNLCREGDQVVIRSCRPLSRWKSHVVVQNYGDKTVAGDDDRAEALEKAVLESHPRMPVEREGERKVRVGKGKKRLADAKGVAGEAKEVSGEADEVSGEAEEGSGEAEEGSGEAEGVSGEAKELPGEAQET